MPHYLKERPTQRELQLFGKQHEFVFCPDRFPAFIGGIGSGKTFAGAVRGLMHAHPGSLGVVVAPTYPMLRDATLRTYLSLFPRDSWNFNKGEMLLTLINGAEILFRSADQPDRLRGPNLHWVHVDEGGLCQEGTWEVLLGRLRADSKAQPLWVTTTPRGKQNWVYRNLHLMTVFKVFTRENPFLDREFVHSLERTYVGEFAQQELEGEFVSFEGLVYAEFDRETHSFDGFTALAHKPKRWIVGVDEGFTNPSACLLIGVDSDERLYVFDEFYKSRILQADFVDFIAQWWEQYKVESIYVDPSAAGLIAALNDRGLPVHLGDNDVTQGIQEVKSRLVRQPDGLPRLMVHNSCVRTMNEFDSYVWKESKSGKPNPKDEPVKQFDHAMDALRYAVMGVGRTHGIYL